MSVQYEAISKSGKNDFFRSKNVTFFLNFCCKHRLWVHVRTASVRGGSNEFPQSMFTAKIRKNEYPCKPQFGVYGGVHFTDMFA